MTKQKLTLKEVQEAIEFGFKSPLSTFEVTCDFWISEPYINEQSPVPMFAAGERPRSGQWVKVDDNDEFDFDVLHELGVKVLRTYKRYIILKGEPDVQDLAAQLNAELEHSIDNDNEPEELEEVKHKTIDEHMKELFEQETAPVTLGEDYPVGATHYHFVDGILKETEAGFVRWSPAGQNWEEFEVQRSRMAFLVDLHRDANGRLYTKHRDKYQDFDVESNAFAPVFHSPQFLETIYPVNPQVAYSELEF